VVARPDGFAIVIANYTSAILTSMWRRIFDAPLQWQAIALAVVPALVVAWLAARLARTLVTAGLRRMLGDTLTTSSALVKGPLRFIGGLTFLLAFATLVFPILDAAGMRPRLGLRLRTLAAWTFESGLRVVLITLLAYSVIRITALVVRRFEHELNLGTNLEALERAKRARTLGSVVRNATAAVVTGVAVLMVLRELRIDISPVLAGAGIVGLAVGFGAQTLVRDIISGFFLILEDQVRVGDVAAINGTGGLVEAINLRTIVLRDIEGTVHVFPNGAITTLANRSKDFSYYVIDISVAYNEDPDRVADVLRKTAAELQADARFGPFILGALEVLGIDAFGDSAMILKTRIKTMPLKQWDVGRELRLRIKRAFDAAGIEIPYPTRVVTTRIEKDQ
jgi:moderate conductance mechanosensitive channel